MEEEDDEYRFSGMMWADNYWMFSDDKDRLMRMVSDIIEELMDVDMELKPESLWWTSTHKGEDEKDAESGKQREKLGFASR